MNIVHVTSTDPAGAAYNLIRAVNTFTPHRARLISTQIVQCQMRLPNGEITAGDAFQFPKDIMDLYDSGDEIDALLKQADVIHFHKVNETFEFEYELRKGHQRKFKLADYVKGKKIVYHIHGHPAERSEADIFANGYKERNAIVLASTPDMEEQYRALGVDARFFPNCVPINDVRYIPRATDDMITGDDGVTKRYCVFQSGTHSILKNMHIIRDVMERLRKELPLFFLHTSPDNLQSQDSALRHKRIAHAVFDHIEGYYGISSLESMSMGKPTIAGLNDYCIEAIKNFFGIRDGFLPWIIARTEDEIEKAIRLLFTDHAQRLAIGLKSREFMEYTWSDKIIAERLVKFYQSL